MLAENLVEVHVVQGMLRAQVIKTSLESAGIPVALEYESVGQVVGITTDGFGEVRIFTPAEYAEDARRLLAGPDEHNIDRSAADGQPFGLRPE